MAEPGSAQPRTPEVDTVDTVGAARADGLTELYRREHEAMVRVASVIVGSRGQAEEIVQDAFEVVGQRWSTLANPGGYLRTTVVNGCRMALRRRTVEARHRVVDAPAIDGPAELVELRDALGRLSERARIVVVLRYLVDLPDAEIADLLGCRPATVRSIVHRALKDLRKELS